MTFPKVPFPITSSRSNASIVQGLMLSRLIDDHDGEV
jgi:hypothetical protein